MKRPGEETLIRYFRGQCSPEEERAIKAWLAMNMDKEYIAACLQEASENSENGDDPAIDRQELDRLWARLTYRQQQHIVVPLKPRTRWYAYAAAVALIVLGGTVFFFLTNNKQYPVPKQIAWERTSAGSGHPKTFRLPDGSTVTLFPGSAIEMPENFNGADRKIKLAGRAFFQISHNSDKPFYVIAQGLTTKVLGTSFEVNASMEDAESIVTLHTGKISISHAGKEIARLNPDHQIRFQNTTEKYWITNVEASYTLGWMQDELDYDQVTLKTIIHDLENWYGVKIVTVNPLLLNRKITISFKGLPVDSTLTMLSQSAGFTYTMQGNQITIKERRHMDSEE